MDKEYNINTREISEIDDLRGMEPVEEVKTDIQNSTGEILGSEGLLITREVDGTLVTLNSSSQSISFGSEMSESITLKAYECRILHLLFSHSDKFFTSFDIGEGIGCSETSVKVYISRMRKKLGEYAYIIETRSQGYRLYKKEIKAQRAKQRPKENVCIIPESFECDFNSRTIVINGDSYSFTAYQFTLICLLLEKDGKTRSYTELETFLRCTKNTLKVHKHHCNNVTGEASLLRILTQWGEGFYINVKLSGADKEQLKSSTNALSQKSENQTFSMNDLVKKLEESSICDKKGFQKLDIFFELHCINLLHFTYEEFYILMILFIHYEDGISFDEIMNNYFETLNEGVMMRHIHSIQKKIEKISIRMDVSDIGVSLHF